MNKNENVRKFIKFIFIIQEDILEEVGQEAFELGLLMEKEFDHLREHRTQSYSFYHLLLFRYLVAKFIATLDKVRFNYQHYKLLL